MVGGASAGDGQGPAVDLEAEPRALSRRMGAVLGASVAILVLIAFADFVATRWLGALAAREARVASLLLEQRALAGEMLLAGVGRDGPAAARFAANRRVLSEGDAARGLPPPGDDGLGAILFRAPHNLGQAMARFAAGPGLDPAGARAMLAALELAHGVAAGEAARAARLRDQAGAGFAIGFLAALAGIALSLFRPMVRLVFGQMRRLVAAHDAVQHAAFHDPATGLPNRDSLMLQLDLALGDPGLDGQILGIVEVHLMRFEIETGPLGHAAAAAALAEMAARLAMMRQGDDIVARLDGAAFVAVFTDILDDAELAVRARRVAERLAVPVAFGEALLCLGPTVGAAAATGGRMLAGQALAAAGVALARARQAGVGAVEATGAEAVLERIAASHADGRDPDAAAAAPRDRTGAHPPRQIALARRSEAGDAAATAEAALRFTPLIELASGRIWAVVLEDAGGGRGLPARPHAGAAVVGIPGPAMGAPPGGASRDGRARLAAMRCLAEWHGRGIAPAVLGLPVLGAELRQPDLADRLLADAGAAGANPLGLMALVRAEDVVGLPDLAVQRTLRRLGAAGMRIGLDGLDRVGAVPLPGALAPGAPDCLCLPAVVLGTASGEIGRAVAALARAFELPLVATGVMDGDLATLLQRHGAALGAGPAFGEALTVAGIADLLTRRQTVALAPRRGARWRRAG